MKRKRSRFDRLMLPTLAAGALLTGIGVNHAEAVLFISEYVEGSSNNKAIEIYNNGPDSVDLAATLTKLEFFFNGSTSATTTINLTGTIASGGTFVVADNDSDAAILAQANQTSTASFFNGDDAVVLSQGATVLDVIGQVGFDPGSQWGSGDNSTADNTIRRNFAVIVGDTNPNDAFDPSGEWTGFAQNTFDGLGSHSGATPPPTPPPPPPPAPSTALVITGIVDGNLSGGSPKFVEVIATEDIADLSVFSLQLFSNGSSSAGNDNPLPAVSLSAGDVFYIVASNPVQQEIDFNTAFPGQTVFTLAAANFNGDDVIRLVEGANIIDQYGVVGVNGDFEPWDYTDSYAFRIDGFGPNQVFTLSEWVFGGRSALPTDSAGMISILGPLLGQYDLPTTAIPEPVTFSMLIIGGVALMSRRQRVA